MKKRLFILFVLAHSTLALSLEDTKERKRPIYPWVCGTLLVGAGLWIVSWNIPEAGETEGVDLESEFVRVTEKNKTKLQKWWDKWGAVVEPIIRQALEQKKSVQDNQEE